MKQPQRHCNPSCTHAGTRNLQLARRHSVGRREPSWKTALHNCPERNRLCEKKNLVNSTELLESTDPNAWQADFVEGNLTDYKEFDAINKTVAYEFGFGLSYITFRLSNLAINVAVANASRIPNPNAPLLPGGNVEIWATLATVSVTVTNTGSVSGATVLQLYLSYPQEADAPVRSLRGFEKIALSPRGSDIVQFTLMRRGLSY